MADRKPTGAWDRFVIKAKEDPFVPLGAAATIGFLLAGFHSFYKGDPVRQQRMMRGRVAAQGITILIMFAGVTMTSSRPNKKRKSYEDKMNELNMEPNIYAPVAAQGEGATFRGEGPKP